MYVCRYDLAWSFLQAGVNNLGPSVGDPYATAGYVWPGNGQSVLINGVGGGGGGRGGGANHNLSSYIDVEPNKIYRFRVLNAALMAYYNFAIAGHNLTVIQVSTVCYLPVFTRAVYSDA